MSASIGRVSLSYLVEVHCAEKPSIVFSLPYQPCRVRMALHVGVAAVLLEHVVLPSEVPTRTREVPIHGAQQRAQGRTRGRHEYDDKIGRR